MSKKTRYLLGILLTIIIGTLLYCYLCDTCDCGFTTTSNDTNIIVETPKTEVKDETSITNNPFTVNDPNGELNLSSKENFNFKNSSFSLIRPVSINVDEAIKKLKTYLDDNPSKFIEVTGYYKSDEVNNSAYPNLGLARANSTKNYLVTKGFSSSRINTKGTLNDDLKLNRNSIYEGPLDFTVLEQDPSENIESLAKKIKGNPLILYFDNAKTSIDLTDNQRQKIADISMYLDKAKNGEAIITGHTDNTGKRTTNLRISQERADFAKSFLIQNGILKSKIKATAVGPDAPIATNATEVGRAKNRRVEVTIN